MNSPVNAVSKEIGVNFMHDYLFSKEDFVRIHISHDDLDGYGSRVIVAANLEWYQRNTAEKVPNSTEIVTHIPAGSRSIKETLQDLITDKELRYMVLITDLSVDPETLIEYTDDGYSVRWAVFDHHKTSEAYSKSDLCKPGNNIDYYCQVGSYYCGTSIIDHVCHEAVRHHYGDHGEMTMKKYNDYMAMLTSYVKNVTSYDNGNWGPWNVPYYSNVAADVIENLYFLVYRSSGNITHYVDDILELVFTNGPDLQADIHIDRNMVFDMWKQIKSEYNKFCHGVTPLTITSGPLYTSGMNGRVMSIQLPALKAYEYIAQDKESEIASFTLISKEFLKNNPDVAILLYNNKPRGVMELRSAEGGLDCSEVAKLNGGGGHARAAGFPLKK